MITKTPLRELDSRMKNFRSFMDEQYPEWEFAVLFSKINIYYFTGTMQDGMLIIERNSSTFWIRKSYERAIYESLFEDLKPMKSYRDAAHMYEDLPETVYIETEVVPLAMYSRFQKHFPFKNFKSLDPVVARVRSVKSHYELSLMRRAGEIHRHVLEDLVPDILVSGMSETEFASDLFKLMMDEGHHGVSRFGMFDTEMVLGQLGFGESSIYPSYFNGPGGNTGISPAVPLIGSRDRKLQRGDLVFVDVGCGVEGYNTDKTMTYMYQAPLKKEVIEVHEICVEIQNEIASMLKPGAVPSEIYRTVIDGLNPEFLENFMGYENRTVKFLGHGIGLLIDETPVIANGFNEPLKEGMVFAVEPKKGIKGVGMVGIENTFIVTKNGGECITGKNPGLIPVDFE
jgi:Xaa-Pro aminopeptidase